MAIGDRVITNYGTFSLSGGTLKAAVDGINITEAQRVSGGIVRIIPVEYGQVLVLREIMS